MFACGLINGRFNGWMNEPTNKHKRTNDALIDGWIK